MRFLDDLRAALREVFSRTGYVALAGVLAALSFLLAVWLPNLGLLARVASHPQAPLAATVGIALSLLGGIGTNFSLLAASYTIAIAALFGMVTAMICYLVKQRRHAAPGQGIAAGSGGAVSGVMGIGCAACGSLVAGVLGPALGAAGGLAALPLEGEEFGIASVVMLAASLLLVGRTIARSGACCACRPPACPGANPPVPIAINPTKET